MIEFDDDAKNNDRLSLPRDEVHVWYTLTADWKPLEQLEAYRGWLSSDEAARQARFVFPRDRHQCLVTRIVERSVLARYTGVEPQAWRFTFNAYGRPEIAAPPPWRSLRYNLSHSRGIVACAVAWDRDLGIDVEDTSRSNVGPPIAQRFFSASEVTQLEARPIHEQQSAFFGYWTLKEAYIKARGMGLAIPLDQFSFDLKPEEPATISIEADLNDRADDWQFEQFSPCEPFLMALAIRRGRDAELTIRVREFAPLAK